MKVTILLVIMSLMICSCSKRSPDCGDPVPGYCKLILVDQNDNLLLGTTYVESTIKLTIENQAIPLIFDNEAIIFDFYNLRSYNNQDFILKLGENEIDTINLNISSYTNECWTSDILDNLKYNKVTIAPLTGNTYKIIK